MYNYNEKPLIRATLFYYDNEYCSEYYPKEILKILKNSPFADPKKYFAGLLTHNKFINTDEKFEEVFIKSYTQKDVFEIDITNGDINKEDLFWEIDWSYTFFKNSKLIRKNTFFKPWNIITISTSYEWVNLPGNIESLLQCLFKIIEVIRPVYGNIDDVNNKVELLEEAGYSCVNIDTIQQIYWGNYFGSELSQKINLNDDVFAQLPVSYGRRIADGFYFSLTNNPLIFKSKEIFKLRKEIKKMFNI